MGGPENLRVYGVLARQGRVLIAEERVAGRRVLKFPGGAVEEGETPEEALVREFAEESGILVRPLKLVHAPGTLFSPWTEANYTPLYYAVAGEGEPRVPPGEALTLAFMDPREAIGSERLAGPEVLTLKRVFGSEE